MMLINRFRAGCLAFSSILLLAAIACNIAEPTLEPTEPIFVTPVAFEPRVPTVEPTSFPRLEERPTLTPTPWPAMPFPLPTRYRIYMGEPMHFSGDPDDDDEVIGGMVSEVKDTIQGMLNQGLAKRRSIFW